MLRMRTSSVGTILRRWEGGKSLHGATWRTLPSGGSQSVFGSHGPVGGSLPRACRRRALPVWREGEPPAPRGPGRCLGTRASRARNGRLIRPRSASAPCGPGGVDGNALLGCSCGPAIRRGANDSQEESHKPRRE